MEKFLDIEFDKGEERKEKIDKLKKAIKKNEIYRNMLLKYIKTVSDIKEVPFKEKEKEENATISFEKQNSVDVSSYMHSILLFHNFEDEEDLYDYLKEVLPSRNEVSNYEQIINTILINLLIEKNEWVDTCFQMKKEKEEASEISLYEEMVTEIQNIIDVILKIRDEKIVDIPEEQNNNHLIFLTRGNKVCFEEDIENMKENEYSLRLQKLLISIKENTFWYKNYRRFPSHIPKLGSFIEVKGFEIRILLRRIDRNAYVVIGALIKKTNWGNGIQQAFINKIDYYETKKAEILQLYQNDDGSYLKQNEEILNGIEEKVKSYVKGGKSL